MNKYGQERYDQWVEELNTKNAKSERQAYIGYLVGISAGVVLAGNGLRSAISGDIIKGGTEVLFGALTAKAFNALSINNKESYKESIELASK